MAKINIDDDKTLHPCRYCDGNGYPCEHCKDGVVDNRPELDDYEDERRKA